MSEEKEGVSFQHLSDSELADIVKKGSDPAFEEMAGRYIGFLYSLAAGFNASGFDKNDFAQEGLLMLLAACRTYDGRTGVSFRNYLALCVKRRYISIQRRSAAREAVGISDAVPIDDIADSADYSLNPEEMIINRERFKNLMLWVGKNLSPLEQNVFSHHIAGYAYAQIAEKLGLSVKSVDNTLQRIRRKLNSYPPA